METGIEWLERCLEMRGCRSNYAAIILSLYYVERKDDNETALSLIVSANSKYQNVSSLCLNWAKSLILMNIEDAESAEKCLAQGIAEITKETDCFLREVNNMNKNHLHSSEKNISIQQTTPKYPLSVDLFTYELSWIQIIQLKYASALSPLELIIAKSLNLAIFSLSTSSKITAASSNYKNRLFDQKNFAAVQKIERNARRIQSESSATEKQQQSHIHIPLKLHMILHLASAFIEARNEPVARAYMEICLFEFARKPSPKKSHEEIARLTTKYLARENLNYLHFELHYFLKQTTRLSDALLLKYRPKVQELYKSLVSPNNQHHFMSKLTPKDKDSKNPVVSLSNQISITSFLSIVNCFIGKNSDCDEHFNFITNLFSDLETNTNSSSKAQLAILAAQKKEHEYILHHFYFWIAMSYFHRKMYEKALAAFKCAAKIKKTEFNISEKVEKNISQLQQFLKTQSATQQLTSAKSISSNTNINSNANIQPILF